MSNIIKGLDSGTINKIAAGEVIESPKSIVKELVENSIDAKADEIIIEIKNGGKNYIRITDNGIGIKKEEMENAFKRHFTSKINDADDLEALQTLGFRGEALASIQEVSKVEMISRTKDDISGTKIVIEGGKIVSKEEVGCPLGTTIVVRDLFFNTPARLKFLKSDNAESMAINEIVLCLSLCTENISFRYINNGNTIYKTPKSSNMLNTISSLYERDLVNSLIEVNYKNEYMTINGYISNLNYYRGNRKYQLLFVNNRYVKLKKANFFIELAYNTLLPKDKHPACFLKIDVAADMVDVNVHPAKTEIRLKNEESFMKDLKYAISSSLRKINLIKEVTSDNSELKKSELKKSEIKEDISKSINVIEFDISKLCENDNEEYNLDINNLQINSKNDFKNDSKSDLRNDLNNDLKIDLRNDLNNDLRNDLNNDLRSDLNNDLRNDLNIINNKDDDFSESINIINHINDIENRSIIERINDIEKISHIDNTSINIMDKSNVSENETFIDEVIRNLKVIGILFNTYILCESSQNQELYIIDQHAAHERINYEKYLHQIENRKIFLQELMIPEIINLSYEDYCKAMDNTEIFDKIGLSIESFGSNDIIISSVPMIFAGRNIKSLFFNILDSIKSLKNNLNLDIEMKKLIKNACVDSVKAGDNLHILEINNLLLDLAKCDSPYTCPHGRPTIIKMTKYQIEKMFERIQA